MAFGVRMTCSFCGGEHDVFDCPNGTSTRVEIGLTDAERIECNALELWWRQKKEGNDTQEVAIRLLELYKKIDNYKRSV